VNASRTKICCATSITAVLVTGSFTAAPSPPPPGAAPGVEALDWAFSFASAIEHDLDDRGKAQSWAVMDYPGLGALDRAVERAGSVEGWRRGVVYADLASELALAGRIEEARRLLARAEDVRRATTGWQGPRISSHMAQALAYLGEFDQAGTIQDAVTAGDARQYRGRMVAALARARGARGAFRPAMDELDRLAGSEEVETAWWRTVAYLDLARNEQLEEPERREALEATERAAAEIGGWKHAEVLTWLAAEWRERDLARARQLLEQAEGLILALNDQSSSKGPMLAELGSAWSKLGDVKRAEKLLAQGLELVPKILVIDQPEVVGRIAASYATMGRADEARRLFDRSLGLAGELVNSRPRALALTAILRSMAGAGVALDEATRNRLVALEAGLGDPW
jgi:tetratricopeptide (TPR) repeat protein